MSGLRRWAPWLALLVVLIVALAVASSGGGTRESQSARVARLTSEIRCPTCAGLSAAESNSETAQAIRADVAKDVSAGQSDGQIFASVRSLYGSDILLRPSASGLVGLVWVLPVVAFVLAGAGLAMAFRRWRRLSIKEASDDDRTRVARALGEQP
ncbi:MAG TPA: cytochrome c-type biogenesis protein CcmH [Acidimicrobiales bacterium]|nr:cytochrome c-type biogenesis protein CcmH [Acidimicrobiales bacterium]